MAPENTPGEVQFTNPFGAAPASAPAPASAEEAPAAPAGAAFGLVFQAADPSQRVPRPAARRPVEDEGETSSEASSSERRDSAEAAEEGDDQTPRRRRRGGRGRRGKYGEGYGDDAEDADDDDASDSSGEKAQTGNGRGSQSKRHDSQGAKSSRESGRDEKRAATEDASAEAVENEQESQAQASDDSDSPNRKRTRRRRRSGSANSENDDPNTVTKVREPRKAKDEVTSIKGSTRLEAKKQRRREGREAGRRRTVVTEAEFLARRESVERVMVVREQEGRTQIGVLEDGVLAEHYVSRHEQAASMAGNVYLGRVQNVLPSMEAAFVDIGRGRNAVLYAGEVNWDAAGLDNQPKRIEHALKAGESVLVQVTKDPIGHKGARLTSQISLPGRFLVYVPGNSMTGISRKLPDTERSRLKKILKEIVPADAGVIVRTAAEGASEEELRADVERLTKMWERIQKKAEKGNAPSLLHGEPDLTVRVIRDVFNEDFSKMIVSGDQAWNEVHTYISDVAPDLVDRLQQWQEERDVFAKYRIDEQLAKAMDRKVWLPSGGSLVIDRTEAMTVVDVNTGKFIGSGGNLEETVTKNNIEAAEEIVRQLRLRDIGGIIVVDFIDMVLESNRELVVRRLLECLGRDRTKHQVAEVTSLGLVQMTRKRVGTGLVEVFSEPCAACNGRGIVIQDHPVETRDINGNDTSRRGRGRRGGRDNSQGSQDSSRTQQPTQQETQSKDNGFAQIAAAAHAAAVSAGDKPSDDPAPVVEVPAEALGLSESKHSESKSAPVGEKPATKRRGSRRAATSTGAPTSAGEAVVMSVSTQTPDSAGATDSQQDESKPATVARRASVEPQSPAASKPKRSRRAASSSGAPVSLEAVDLASAHSVRAPLTKVAGEAVSSPVAEETVPATQVAKAPARKKRARVVAPAGAPGKTGEQAADGDK